MWAWLAMVVGKKELRHSRRRTVPAKRLKSAHTGAESPHAGVVEAFDRLVELAGRPPPERSRLTQREVDADQELAERVREHFAKNQPPPSALPAISLQVLSAVANPELPLFELSRLIAQDPALSASILKVANLVVYGGVQEIESLRHAVTRLGSVEVGRIAGMVAARSLFQPQLRSEFAAFGARWNEIFAGSVATARGAAWQAMLTRGTHPDQCFLAGILHDLGRSVALRSIASLSLAGAKLDPADPRIDRVLELVHVEIGGEVHANWGLPRFPTLVVMRHHDLQLPTDGEYVDLHLVRLVSALLQLRSHRWRVAEARAELEESCHALHLDAFHLRALDTHLREELQNVSRTVATPHRA